MPGPKATTQFHGKPCPRCGSTLRQQRGGRCVKCRRARERGYDAQRRQDPSYQEAQRHRQAEWFQNLPGLEYNRLLLKNRRARALKRMAERNEREAT